MFLHVMNLASIYPGTRIQYHCGDYDNGIENLHGSLVTRLGKQV
jgi:hypothetical protein